jgi:hypothetical protein
VSASFANLKFVNPAATRVGECLTDQITAAKNRLTHVFSDNFSAKFATDIHVRLRRSD